MSDVGRFCHGFLFRERGFFGFIFYTFVHTSSSAEELAARVVYVSCIHVLNYWTSTCNLYGSYDEKISRFSTVLRGTGSGFVRNLCLFMIVCYSGVKEKEKEKKKHCLERTTGGFHGALPLAQVQGAGVQRRELDDVHWILVEERGAWVLDDTTVWRFV